MYKCSVLIKSAKYILVRTKKIVLQLEVHNFIFILFVSAVLLWTFVSLLITLFQNMNVIFGEGCNSHGSDCLSSLCSLYKNGRYDGSLCQDLCMAKISVFGYCKKFHSGKQVFHDGQAYDTAHPTRPFYSGVTCRAQPPSGAMTSPPSGLTPTYRYFAGSDRLAALDRLARSLPESVPAEEGYPGEATTMAQFVSALRAVVTSKVTSPVAGHNVSSQVSDTSLDMLADHLLLLADANHDNRVTREEARSLWQLLPDPEFYLLAVYAVDVRLPASGGGVSNTRATTATSGARITARGTSGSLARLRGFCAGVYRVDTPEHSLLYTRQSGFWARVLGTAGAVSTWWLPPWSARVKIALGIIELVEDLYQHPLAGMFYMCGGIDESTIGYTNTYEVFFLDTSLVYPRGVVEHFARSVPCTDDADCRITDQCSMICDKKTSRCTGELVRPNLYHVCKLVKDFLLYEAAKQMRINLLYLFSRCERLDNRRADRHLEHSLLVNEFTSVLWANIKNEKFVDPREEAARQRALARAAAAAAKSPSLGALQPSTDDGRFPTPPSWLRFDRLR